jgi:hypothetical protein
MVIKLKDHYSKILNAVCHFEIVNDNLVITIDHENRSFADLEYLKLIGQDPFGDNKHEEEYKKGATTTDIVQKYYQKSEIVGIQA